MKKNRFGKTALSLLLTLAMLVACLSVGLVVNAAGGTVVRQELPDGSLYLLADNNCEGNGTGAIWSDVPIVSTSKLYNSFPGCDSNSGFPQQALRLVLNPVGSKGMGAFNGEWMLITLDGSTTMGMGVLLRDEHNGDGKTNTTIRMTGWNGKTECSDQARLSYTYGQPLYVCAYAAEGYGSGKLVRFYLVTMDPDGTYRKSGTCHFFYSTDKGVNLPVGVTFRLPGSHAEVKLITDMCEEIYGTTEYQYALGEGDYISHPIDNNIIRFNSNRYNAGAHPSINLLDIGVGYFYPANEAGTADTIDPDGATFPGTQVVIPERAVELTFQNCPGIMTLGTDKNNASGYGCPYGSVRFEAIEGDATHFRVLYYNNAYTPYQVTDDSLEFFPGMRVYYWLSYSDSDTRGHWYMVAEKPDGTYQKVMDGHNLYVDVRDAAALVLRCDDAPNGNDFSYTVRRFYTPDTITTLGAQVCNEYRTDAGLCTALRFGSQITCEGALLGEAYASRFGVAAFRDATASYRVLEVGTLVGRSAKVSAEDMTVENADGKYLLNIKAEKTFDISEDGKTVTVTAVVTNVPQTHYDEQLLARAYVKYTDGKNTVIRYGEAISRSVNDVLA